MPVVDFYEEVNQSADYGPLGGPNSSDESNFGQSFTGDGSTLHSSKFYLKKVGSPTGNARSYIYEHTGTFGIDGKPTGNALATSGTFNVATLTTSYQLVEFLFTSANQISLTDGTRFVVVVEYFAGDSATDYLLVGGDNTFPGHAGNYSQYSSNTDWVAGLNGEDLIFYVYSVDTTVPPISPPSSRFILDGTQIKRPTSITEERQSVTALKRMMSGKMGRDLFAGDKRLWKLSYENVTADDYTEIYDIYTAYLSSETPVTWQIESSNYEVEQTEVHIDLNVREFSVPGSSYISEFELVLVEA